MLLVILTATFHWNNLSAAYLPGDSILLSSGYSGDRKRKWVPAAHPETSASEQALAWVSAFLRRGWRRVGGKVLEIFISPSATPLSPHIHSFRAKAAWPGKWSVIGKKKNWVFTFPLTFKAELLGCDGLLGLLVERSIGLLFTREWKKQVRGGSRGKAGAWGAGSGLGERLHSWQASGRLLSEQDLRVFSYVLTKDDSSYQAAPPTPCLQEIQNYSLRCFTFRFFFTATWCWDEPTGLGLG